MAALALALLGSVLISTAQLCLAMQVEIAASAFEEGDDRQRPALQLALLDTSWRANLSYAHRHFGPVTDAEVLIQVMKRFAWTGTPMIDLAYGVALLDEITIIHYSDADAKRDNENDQEFNLG